jgi:hypothetical protein
MSMESELDLTRVAINDVSGGAGISLWIRGGVLTMQESAIEMSASEADAVLFENDADVTIADSMITVDGLVGGVVGTGTLELIRSTVVANGGEVGLAVGFTGEGLIDSSTISASGGRLAVGIRASGSLEVVNSTIVDVISGTDAPAGIFIRPDSTASIVNSTITGTTLASSSSPPADPPDAWGIFIDAGSTASLANSIVDDSIGGPGTLASNGANTFRDTTVTGAVAGDRLGVGADQLFATVKTIAGATTLSGVLADNGGPTLTVALLDDPANPAVDAADPRLAPFIDQRGFLRDVAPDIGAFELGAGPPGPLPPLPPLAEKVPLADADIRGAPSAFSTLVGDDASIAFVDEYAAQQNSLGVYLVDPDGTIESPQWVFERVEHSQPSDLASELARPGGGPLSPGDAVLLSELFDPADLGRGVEFGLFLVADGAARNPAAVFDSGTLEFRTGGAPATVTDTTPQLVHIAENGVERLVQGDILHTVDAGSPNPLSNTLNPGGGGQVTSGLLGGVFGVAFEDKPLAESDRDFNDAIFAIDLFDEAPVAATSSAGAEVVAMDSLVTAAETV